VKNMASKEFRSFKGKVCLVTGAASGIGRALSTRLAASGAHVEASDLDGERAAKIPGITRASRSAIAGSICW